MTFQQRAIDEIQEIGLTALYFACCFVALMFLKRLVLAEYQIEFGGLSLALIGALVVAKVVLILEHVPLGRWIQHRPAAVDVAARTLLYALGVFGVMLVEKAFDTRHEAGGFGAALVSVFRHRDIHHVWAATIGIGGALLGFNVLSVVRRRLGEGELRRLLFAEPSPESTKT
jgi:hypothetical protein